MAFQWMYIVFFAIGIIAGFGVYHFYLMNQKKKASDLLAEKEQEARKLLLEKEEEARKLLEQKEKEGREIIKQAESKSQSIIDKAENETSRRMQKVEDLEEKVMAKDERLEKKLEDLEKEKENVKTLQEEAQKTIDEQKTVLEGIAKMSESEAKEKMFQIIEQENKDDIVQFIQKYKVLKEEDADKEAANIIADILPKVCVDVVTDFTVSEVELPSEDTKGKIIGREGRNISYFEKIAGVEVIIDDTPQAVRISGYDPEKRFMAVETMKKLVKDGRINPVYIEKAYKEVVSKMDEYLRRKGEEALSKLNLPLMKPDVVKMIGQFNLRYSYGQNLWIHSLEVAKISELIANELGLDGIMAKKAGILHDIGKITAQTGEGHSKVGGEILKKYGFSDIVVNAAESHHGDVPVTSPIGWIVMAADAISAGRPGARFNTKEQFIERMSNLEKLIMSVGGVDKTYIMQAGREIMAFVNPDDIDDLALEKTVQEVGKKIEDQLDYPGVIRVVAIRENKVVHYLK